MHAVPGFTFIPHKSQINNDLKRIGIDETTLTIRNAPWNCNGILFQFPATEVFIELAILFEAL